MSGIFGKDYAAAYDTLYGEKDYEGECDLIERVLAEHGAAGSRRILDLGCGTGNHVLPLIRRDHAVTGVDRSPGMLARARAKAAEAEAVAAFHEGDVRDIDLGARFDAVLMMFAVLGYQRENADLKAALGTVRRHLEPGGLFVFDVWNGPAVLSDRPGQRVRTIRDGDTRIIRLTSTALDAVGHCCRVRFDLLRLEGDRVAGEQSEEHVMRFFFPLELDLALGSCGLALETLRAFPGYDAPPDERAWNVIGIARAI
jgi:SAM-dependent methyltransferase